MCMIHSQQGNTHYIGCLGHPVHILHICVLLHHSSSQEGFPANSCQFFNKGWGGCLSSFPSSLEQTLCVRLCIQI